MIIEDQVKPSIKVAVSQKFVGAEILKEVVSGIEEESIPYDIIYLPEDEAVKLAYKAAQASDLEVGIGVDSKGYLAVHYVKLSSDMPLFALNYHLEREKLRSVCSNGARLTKGTPFILE